MGLVMEDLKAYTVAPSNNHQETLISPLSVIILEMFWKMDYELRLYLIRIPGSCKADTAAGLCKSRVPTRGHLQRN